MLLHFPLAVRPAVAALWTIDETLAAVVAEATQPALAAIKLAWWAEALARLDTAPPPPEPRLQAVADTLIVAGVRGAEVAELEEGWAALLDEHPEPARVAGRGRALLAIEARLLEANDPHLPAAGAVFALTDARRRGCPAMDQALAEYRLQLAGWRVPRALRPVTLTTRLALRPPGEPEGTPARALALIAHRLTGRLPLL